MGFKLSAAIAGLCIWTAAPALAQDQSTNRVAAKTDWSVFTENEPKECWAVSAPKKTVNTRDGAVVSAKRSDILLMVFFRPGDGVKGQVAFTGGYPFAPNKSVNLNIGGTEFELFAPTENNPATPLDDREWAWPASPGDDLKIITAMKRGSDAVLTAQSARGTQTKDSFSLLGFTAAVEDAEKRCAG